MPLCKLDYLESSAHMALNVNEAVELRAWTHRMIERYGAERKGTVTFVANHGAFPLTNYKLYFCIYQMDGENVEEATSYLTDAGRRNCCHLRNGPLFNSGQWFNVRLGKLAEIWDDFFNFSYDDE